MSRHDSPVRDLVGFALLYAQLAATFWIVPDWSPSHIGEPTYLAGVGNVVGTFVISAIRLSGRRGSIAERAYLALFLGAMPFVYLSSWILTPQQGWLLPELVGVAIFVAAAVLGWRGSIWWLAFGIAAHGLFWDLWHYGHTAFIPDWYTVGCLITDVSLGVYVALLAPAFDAASAPLSLSIQPRRQTIAEGGQPTRSHA